MEKFGPENFSRYCQRSMEQEKKYWEMAKVLDLTASDNARASDQDATRTSSNALENNLP